MDEARERIAHFDRAQDSLDADAETNIQPTAQAQHALGPRTPPGLPVSTPETPTPRAQEGDAVSPRSLVSNPTTPILEVQEESAGSPESPVFTPSTPTLEGAGSPGLSQCIREHDQLFPNDPIPTLSLAQESGDTTVTTLWKARRCASSAMPAPMPNVAYDVDVVSHCLTALEREFTEQLSGP